MEMIRSIRGGNLLLVCQTRSRPWNPTPFTASIQVGSLYPLSELFPNPCYVVATDMSNMLQNFLPGPVPIPPPLYQDDPSKLPGWLKAPSSRIDHDEFDYLQSRGALLIPDQHLRDECFACFMEWVYPYSPVVDLAKTVQAISSKDGSGGHVSLLVFQAIMFAGIGHVAMSSLHLAGFQSRKEAKKAFFRKVKVKSSVVHLCFYEC